MESLATTPEGSKREMQSRFDQSAWSYQNRCKSLISMKSHQPQWTKIAQFRVRIY